MAETALGGSQVRRFDWLLLYCMPAPYSKFTPRGLLQPDLVQHMLMPWTQEQGVTGVIDGKLRYDE